MIPYAGGLRARWSIRADGLSMLEKRALHQRMTTSNEHAIHQRKGYIEPFQNKPRTEIKHSYNSQNRHAYRLVHRVSCVTFYQTAFLLVVVDLVHFFTSRKTITHASTLPLIDDCGAIFHCVAEVDSELIEEVAIVQAKDE